MRYLETDIGASQIPNTVVSRDRVSPSAQRHGGLVASEGGDGRDGRDAPSAAAAAPPAPQRRLGCRAAAPPGSPEGDLPGVPLSDRTGDRPGHRHAHHGDLSDHEICAGTEISEATNVHLINSSSCCGLIVFPF